MAQSGLFRQSLHPKFLPTWIGFAFFWLAVQVLPYRVQIRLGAYLGALAIKRAKRRRKIAQQNIAACYPDMPEDERLKLLIASAESFGMSLFESGMAWFWPAWRLKRLSSIEGLEHLEQAKSEDKGVLLLAIHFTPIEICAAFINRSISIDGFYQRHKNPVYEMLQRHGRERHNYESQTIPRTNVRRIVRALRNKRVINYAVDQDYGAKNSVFSPFFGIQTATITAPAKLVKMTKAKAIFYTTQRREDGKGYLIKIYPPLESFGELGEEGDVSLLNEFVEARVRENPAQYLWVHRRFKTRPPGEAPFYNL
jgi:KDO2-lipid IV(A) lauroyltransferase